MSDRLKPREITENPDLQLIGSFGGLSSASYNRTGDIVYQDKLVNAYVNKSGYIVKRTGSQVSTSIAYFDNATGNGVQKFNFDNTGYMIAKVGLSLVLLATKDNVGYTSYRTFTGVFRTNAANDRPSFAIKTEGNYCHVLVACANQQMICITIVKSVITSAAIAGNGTTTGLLQYPISGSVLNTTNSIVRQDNKIVQPTSVTHTDGNISLSSSELSTLTVSKPIRIHSFFFLRFCDAQYFPGLYMVNSALRRNQVPLDVNVQVPQELQANPIINEPSQLVDRETLYVYEGNTKRTRVGNRQPASATDWDFSDGSYFTGAGLLTNASPSFVSFGGYSSLAVNGSSTTITVARLRYVLVNGLTGNLRCFVNKTLANPVYHDSNTNAIVANGVKPTYFSFATAGVNVNLSAVVELIDTAGTTNGINNSSNIVNLDTTDNSITIGDGYCIPFYGLSYSIAGGIYPDTIAFIGNRLVMVAKNSRIIFSDANWNYRGITFNNCQVSTINFSETSAFSVNISQGASVVKGFESVRGVAIVATDAGIFRISSSSGATKPANATDATVSKVSSELVPNNDCFGIFDNRIFYVSNNGLYALEYVNESAELVNQSMSTNVSNKFADVDSLSYVKELRSFVMTRVNTTELLAFNIDSESYYSIKFATSAKPYVFNDCFFFVVPSESSTNMLVCTFDQTQTTDLSNFNNFSYTLPGRTRTISSQPTTVATLVCPAELVPTLAPAQKIVQAPGYNNVRLLGGGSYEIQEYADFSTGQSLPIDAYVVTKAFFGGRLDQSSRIVSVNLMLAGAGSITTVIVQPTNDYADRVPRVELWQISNDQSQGEPMLNAQYADYSVRASAGNTNVISLRQLGISEGWALAAKLSGVSLLGLQFITNVKSRKRLR